MKMTPVKSSNIDSIGYDDLTKRLDVKFKGGKTFCYADVTRDEHEQLMAAKSIGAHFGVFIKATKVCTESILDPKDKLIDAQATQISALRRHIIEIAKVAAYAPTDHDVLAITKAALDTSMVES